MANNSINAIKPVTFINTKDTDYKWTDLDSNGAPGGKVEIIIDGVTYTTSVNDDGKWSFTPPGGWAEGMHTLQITFIDRATNRGTPGSYIVNVDKSAPAQPEIWRAVDNTGSDTGNLTPGDNSDERKPVLSGVAEPNSIVYLYDNAGATPIASIKANEMGAWTITPELENGGHTLTVMAKDANGNESVKSPEFKLTIASGTVVAADAPEASHAVVAPADFGTFAQNEKGATTKVLTKNIITPHGENEEPNVLVQVIINNEVFTTMTKSDGSWALNPIELVDGTYFYQLRLIDRAGNWGIAGQQILIVDGAIPDAPEIMRVIDNDGTLDYLSSNQYTNDKTPTLSGVAQPGSVVYIYANSSTVFLGTVQAGDDGRWTFEPTLTTDGAYIFNASYINPQNIASGKSDNFVINLDTSTPGLPTLGEVLDDEGSYKGPLKSGDTTDDKTPTFSGTADAGALVRIWDGNDIIASVIAGPRGEWSIDLDLEDGPHSLRVDSQSKGGNTSPKTEEFELIVDPTMLPPGKIEEIVANNGDTEIPLKDGDSTNDTTPVLRGSGNDGDIIHIIDNGVEVGTAVVKDGAWEFELPEREEEELSLVVEVESGGKRSGPSDPVVIIIDTTPPVKPAVPEIIDNEGDKTGPLLPGDATDDNTPEFKGGGAEEGDTVEIIIVDEDGNKEVIGTAIVGPGGDWTVTPENPIPDGEHQLIVEITDPAGNTSQPSDPITVIIDTGMPDALEDFDLIDNVGAITGPIKEGDTTDDMKPTLEGKGVDGTTVIIYDNDVEIGRVKVANGEWKFEPDLGEGPHTITVQPESASGVKGPVSDGISFTVDISAPTTGAFTGVYTDASGTDVQLVPDAQGRDPAINDKTLIMKGTGADGDIVVVYGTYDEKDEDGNVIDTITMEVGKATIVGGAWRIETVELADHEYTFTVGIRDVAGNEYKLATEINVEVDTLPPGPPDLGGLFSVVDLNEDLMHMSLNDILSQSSDSLFIDNGKTQMIVSEKAGQDLKLEDILPQGEDVNNWSQANGTVTVAGVEYNVYQNNGGDAEVMVPQHLMQEQQH